MHKKQSASLTKLDFTDTGNLFKDYFRPVRGKLPTCWKQTANRSEVKQQLSKRFKSIRFTLVFLSIFR